MLIKICYKTRQGKADLLEGMSLKYLSIPQKKEKNRHIDPVLSPFNKNFIKFIEKRLGIWHIGIGKLREKNTNVS